MPIDIDPSGELLGATLKGVDLAVADDKCIDGIVAALGRYGVIRFPHQQLTPLALKTFSARFGALEINVAGSYQVPGLPEVMILSNMVENGKAVGLSDAGQSWHTDMSYSSRVAFVNVLHAIKVPLRA